MTGATGNLYFGLHEFSDMAFVLHALRPGDVFVDAGANVGVYTVLASAHVGATSYSFEPDSVTFGHLKNNIVINHISQSVQAHNMALGREQGTLQFTKGLDTVNHVVKTDAISTSDGIGSQSVHVMTLDSLHLPALERPIIIKIDVEGFETEVIHGAKNLLTHPQPLAIIIELNGSGGRYGYREEDIHQTLLQYGYRPYVYDPFRRALNEINTFGHYNTIYIRHIALVQERCLEAEKVEVLSIAF